MYILLFLLVLVGCSGIPEANVSFDSVVSVSIDQNNIIGSAVAINSTEDATYFLTCKHVAVENPRFVGYKGSHYKIITITCHDSLDIAVFKTEKVRITVVLFSIGFEEYDQVYSVGYPVGIGKVTAIGIINCPLPDIKNGWLCSAPAYKGNSGGGVFSKEGHLIGITVAIIGAGTENGFDLIPHLHVFIPANYFFSWMEGTYAR